MLINIVAIALVLQLLLLVADIVFNTIVGIFYLQPQVQVAIYIVQDVVLLLAAGSFCALFCSSWYYVSGLLQPVFRLFGGIVLCWFIYFGLTLGMHVWVITAWYQNDSSVPFLPDFVQDSQERQHAGQASTGQGCRWTKPIRANSFFDPTPWITRGQRFQINKEYTHDGYFLPAP
ncbi:hypothetical protein RvY_10618 [Ramazzottius varieornatus]|uniref:Transmembrane protein 138 n=1 Tax=Ramazzottius varieornatus TaxID=947166 RepID=A0A1D1VFE9_RAMVA|nr:hypothetical protein RvY_10618 [Ramazzottius varieornatus]